jgi:uncharacterized membrane protein YphA (DoxX/SURF4 family)
MELLMTFQIRPKIIMVLRLVAAGVLLQTLYFKFTGAPESVFIFTTLGVEPWGRWFSGLSELVASLLLLIPSTQVLGAAMALCIMFGALASHILILGIVVQDDGGLLFGLALVVSLSCALILFLQRDEIKEWINRGLGLLQPKIRK